MKSLFTAILLSYSLLTYAQNAQTLFVAKYKYTVIADLSRPQNLYQENMMLLIGKNSSLFKSYEKFKRDSAINRMNSLDMNQFSGSRMVTEDEILRIYHQSKGYNSKKIGLQYYWEEEMPLMSWTMSTDTATIAGYKCQKATCFSERNHKKYLAWFAAELPFPAGPTTFGGLPGLIVKLEAEDKSLAMELFAFEKPYAGTEEISFGKKAVKTTKEVFNKALAAYKNDPLQFLKNSGALTGGVSGVNTTEQ